MKKRISTIAIMLAMFFLPLGYDALFKYVMNKTGSYWIADVLFYCISGLFFAVHFVCEGYVGKMYRAALSLPWLKKRSE